MPSAFPFLLAQICCELALRLEVQQNQSSIMSPLGKLLGVCFLVTALYTVASAIILIKFLHKHLKSETASLCYRHLT